MATVLSTAEVIASANELLAAHEALILRVRSRQQEHREQLRTLYSPPQELLQLSPIPSPAPSPPPDDSPPLSPLPQPVPRSDLPPAKKARVSRYHNYVPEEETIRNDYSQRYVDGGEWPQNWVLGAEPEHRFEEYPKQQRLLNLKKSSVNQVALPPTYLPYADLTSLHPNKFDVILIDPPFSSSFTWDHLQEISIPSLAGDPSFVFLWVGSGAGEGLERGREILAKWGYRRCEDVVWIKTNNTTNQGPGTDPPTTSLLTRTKQHCLMGIRGTVRRSTDSWFVHCNVDTDVIIWEGDPEDPTRKPPEMYTLIENFCLGFRRLEIFGKLSSLRRGWVTALAPGQDERLPSDGRLHVEGEEGGTATRWMQETWEEGLKELSNGGKPVVPMTAEIDALRPKSPVRPGQTTSTNPGHAGSGGGSGGALTAQAMGMGAGMGGLSAPRFQGANRGGGGVGGGQGQMMGQNQMMVQPVMGMGAHQMAAMGMGNIDEMMGGWNPMMGGIGGMGGVNASGGMGNRGMGMGNVNAGMGGGISSGAMGNIGPMGAMPMQMMGQMGIGNVGVGGFPMQGAGPFGTVFNSGMNAWGDQGQFGMGEAWDDGMNGMNMNMPNMAGGMGMASMGNMGNMANMNGMGMNQQWGSGNF
ncbi:unnamed protein product [Cyclocybe aegerita]|uniref:MT-A70-domain-containing protein n=1 Tax=Cyclocybe aegerita TaxID=1973307 RepID=A0A8S0WZC5_CYCAE|nr:unnamed protein product [Cyclocybe aegerita]